MSFKTAIVGWNPERPAVAGGVEGDRWEPCACEEL
jgi:hypothetical protein